MRDINFRSTKQHVSKAIIRSLVVAVLQRHTPRGRVNITRDTSHYINDNINNQTYWT